MSIAVDSDAILEAALKLSPQNREELVRKLIISLDADQEKDPDYDRLWAEEIESRMAAIERGEAKLYSVDEAISQIRESLRTGKPLE